MSPQMSDGAEFCGSDLLAQIAAVAIGAHRLADGWPMMAVFVGGAEVAIEVCEARDIANALQTLAEKIIRRADLIEEDRTLITNALHAIDALARGKR